MDVYGHDNPDKKRRDLFEKYEEDPVFTFETNKNTGLPTSELALLVTTRNSIGNFRLILQVDDQRLSGRWHMLGSDSSI